jgi:hypothetical protein
MKITLKCEQPSYDIFSGKEGPIERTVTHEFTSGSLGEALENFEMFLRGIGYTFDGQLNIVTDEVVEDTIEYQGVDVDEQISSQVMNQMVDSLLKNVKIEPIEQTGTESCSKCGISKSVMQNLVCWDSVCPVHGRGQ